jgi:hypothetical protein
MAISRDSFDVIRFISIDFIAKYFFSFSLFDLLQEEKEEEPSTKRTFYVLQKEPIPRSEFTVISEAENLGTISGEVDERQTSID